MSNFNGIVYLTKEQYNQLKTDGTLTVGDITVNFDESTLYVTDELPSGGSGSSEEILDLTNRTSAVETQLSSLAVEVANTQQDVTDNMGDITALDGRVTSLENTGGVSQEDFDKLVNNTTRLKANSNNSFYIGRLGDDYTQATVSIIGEYEQMKYGQTLIGSGSKSKSDRTVLLGSFAKVGSGASYGICIGAEAEISQDTGSRAIQIGRGTNSTANTLQICDDNIYNHNTHTLTVQNIDLNGVDLQGTLSALEGQNEYIGRYEGNSYTAETIQTELSSFVSTTAGRAARNGDLVNIVNGIYAGQQWRFGGTLWIYYINFENHSVINNLNSTSTTDGLSAAQGKVLSDEILRLDGEVSGNTEDIAMLQGDMAGKTNVTFNNVHQDYVNFSSDPQTQINTLNTNINNKTIKLAWTNQNAGQAIGDTAISLGTVLFDYCIIECCVSTDKIHERVTQIFIPHLDNVYEEYCLMNCYDGRANKSYSRQILKGNGENGSKGYLYFSKAFANGTQDNTKLVPYKVYIGRF